MNENDIIYILTAELKMQIENPETLTRKHFHVCVCYFCAKHCISNSIVPRSFQSLSSAICCFAKLSKNCFSLIFKYSYFRYITKWNQCNNCCYMVRLFDAFRQNCVIELRCDVMTHDHATSHLSKQPFTLSWQIRVGFGSQSMAFLWPRLTLICEIEISVEVVK